MRARPVLTAMFAAGVLLIGIASASAQQTRNGTFSVQGFVGDDLAGRNVSYGNDSLYTADIHSDNSTLFVDHMYFYVQSPDGNWFLELRAGGALDLVPGRYCFSTGGTNNNPPTIDIDFGPGGICSPVDATFNVSTLIVEYPADSGPALVSLNATFSIRCSGQTQFNNGSVSFNGVSTGAPRTPTGSAPTSLANCDGSAGGSGGGGGGGGGIPTPGGGGSGGGGTGTGTLGGFPHPGGGIFPTPGSTTVTPDPTPAAPTPAITILTNMPSTSFNNPVLTTADSVEVPLLVVTSTLDSPVVLSATSEPEGLEFTFPNATIKGSGAYDTKVTVKPSASAVPRDYRVDVTASSAAFPRRRRSS